MRIRTKRELLKRIAAGEASVRVIYTVAMYQVGMTADPDPNGGVWIALSEKDFIVNDYADVYARVDNRNVRLSQAEADAVRLYITDAMRSRARGWAVTTHRQSP